MASHGGRGAFNPRFRPAFNQGAGSKVQQTGGYQAGGSNQGDGGRGAGGRGVFYQRRSGFGQGRGSAGRGQSAAAPGQAPTALGGAPQIRPTAPTQRPGIVAQNTTRGTGMTTISDFASAENMEIDTSMDQSVEHGAMVESQEKTKHKPYCYRCLTKGHTVTNCQASILCEECGSEDHITKACSPYKNLKFMAIPSGYAVEGLGFYNIPYSGPKKGDKTSTLAEIIIIDGAMSTANVETELKRLVPGDWDRKVMDYGGSFTAIFPSSNELNRLVEWGPVVAKCAKAILNVQEKEGDYYCFEIPKVWVQFRGLPDDILGNFNILWAIGTALGVSRRVDLKFTREHKIAKIKVGCLDPDLIPEFLSMLIGEHVYDLQFRAEKNIDPENPVPIDTDLDPPRDNGNDNSQEDPELPDNEYNNGMDVVDSGPKVVGKGSSASHGKKMCT
ncbi:hypothetical protein BS78_07G152400 [Paspalum vaginatum]|nr:hypothetical protein BS78_07G152400 [Paspalum vaginatum]